MSHCTSGYVLVTSGSFARREASSLSDIDYFAVAPGTSVGQQDGSSTWVKTLGTSVSKIVPKAPAGDGAFAAIEYHDEMLKNIGGSKDSNEKITRRVLLLLEGDWIAGQDGFRTLRREILEHYIKGSITDHQLALFLLNDIIRYYRTIAVDYEFKTEEIDKPWAIRNIKLIFSRKLLYASGLFSVAMTADHAYPEKIARLEELFEIPVIDRMIEICGRTQMEKVLTCYDHFLEALETPALRAHLDALPKNADGRTDEQFRKLKNVNRHRNGTPYRLAKGTPLVVLA